MAAVCELRTHAGPLRQPNMSTNIDLGHDHTARPYVWDPDLELNPQFGGAPGSPDDVVGYIIDHPHPQTGGRCSGSITLDTERARFMGEEPRWQVVSLDPLHVEPSVLCKTCGDHGFIRDGRWQPA